MQDFSIKTPLLIYFNFFPKFFPKIELPNSRCSLSASAAYMPVFTVINMYVNNYQNTELQVLINISYSVQSSGYIFTKRV